MKLPGKPRRPALPGEPFGPDGPCIPRGPNSPLFPFVPERPSGPAAPVKQTYTIMGGILCYLCSSSYHLRLYYYIFSLPLVPGSPFCPELPSLPLPPIIPRSPFCPEGPRIPVSPKQDRLYNQESCWFHHEIKLL